MKITYLSAVRIPTKNAHGFQIVKMCEAFAKAGHEVELVVPWRKNLLREDPYEFYGVERTFRIQKVPAIDLYPFRFIPEHLTAFLHLTSFLISSRVYLWRTPYDILYTREIFAGFLFSKFVYEIHSLPARVRPHYRWLISRAKKVVAITAHLTNAVTSFRNAHQAVLLEPDAVDATEIGGTVPKLDARKKLDIPASSQVVVYTGNFRSWKGVDTLARTVHLLPNLFFILVGGTKDADIARIKETVRGAKNVRVLGYRPHSEMVLYTASADVLVMPNAKGKAISENYTSPLKLFEYMASGRPIVASDLPSLREILNQENAVFFEAGDSSDLALKIDAVLRDEPLARRLSAQALIDVTPYTWDKRAERIVAFCAPGR